MLVFIIALAFRLLALQTSFGEPPAETPVTVATALPQVAEPPKRAGPK